MIFISGETFFQWHFSLSSLWSHQKEVHGCESILLTVQLFDKDFGYEKLYFWVFHSIEGQVSMWSNKQQQHLHVNEMPFANTYAVLIVV